MRRRPLCDAGRCATPAAACRIAGGVGADAREQRRVKAALKERVKRGARDLAYVTGFSAWRARSLPAVRILMFHNVGDRRHPLELFEAQLEYLARHFTICGLPEALSRLHDGRVVGDEVILTFDDGLETHGTRVYPVLERLQLPCSFFVCPGLIESRSGIWTLEVRARLAALPAARAWAWLHEVGAPAGTDVDQTLEWLKGLPATRSRELTERLRQAGATESGDSTLHFAEPLMSWGQLRRLDPSLVTIGSHSLTHPILPRLEDAELEREIRDSRQLLEQRLGRPVQFFCFPDGAYDERATDLTRRYYDAAVTTVEGWSQPGDDLQALPRIPGARSLSLLAWRLHRPRA
jgi:peptidoglycan/xylan/chitin deacetylase (PgdA/CDA1 family)